jgi:hypothetical protein
MIDDKTTTKPRNMSIKSYRKMKIKMLKEFHIYLTPEHIDRINSLQTEIAIDNFCISLIQKSYN